MGKVVSFSKWFFFYCLVDIYIYFFLRKLWGERETLDLNFPSFYAHKVDVKGGGRFFISTGRRLEKILHILTAP